MSVSTDYTIYSLFVHMAIKRFPKRQKTQLMLVVKQTGSALSPAALVFAPTFVYNQRLVPT